MSMFGVILFGFIIAHGGYRLLLKKIRTNNTIAVSSVIIGLFFIVAGFICAFNEKQGGLLLNIVFFCWLEKSISDFLIYYLFGISLVIATIVYQRLDKIEELDKNDE